MEIREYQGTLYYRYPDSTDKSYRNYFKDSNYKALHRDVWKSVNGNIPYGYVIHHKDHNTLNNDISNLEMMSRDEHTNYHRLMVRMIGFRYWISPFINLP